MGPIHRLLQALLIGLIALAPGCRCAPKKRRPPPRRAPGLDLKPMVVQGVGLRRPEAVLHDPVLDAYLVANVGGDPLARDGNGFISRVSPGGRVITLKWIDGAAQGVELDGPRGMAFSDKNLFVADITHVRVFDRRTGAPVGSHKIAAAVHLVDVVHDRAIWFALDAGSPDASPDLAAIHTWSFPKGTPGPSTRPHVKRGPLGQPAALELVDDESMIGVTVRGEVFRTYRGERFLVARSPLTGLAGIALLPDGSFLIASSAGGAIQHLGLGWKPVFTTVFPAVASPGNVGYDAKRHRLLIPQGKRNTVQIQPLRPELGRHRPRGNVVWEAFKKTGIRDCDRFTKWWVSCSRKHPEAGLDQKRFRLLMLDWRLKAETKEYRTTLSRDCRATIKRYQPALESHGCPLD